MLNYISALVKKYNTFFLIQATTKKQKQKQKNEIDE